MADQRDQKLTVEELDALEKRFEKRRDSRPLTFTLSPDDPLTVGDLRRLIALARNAIEAKAQGWRPIETAPTLNAKAIILWVINEAEIGFFEDGLWCGVDGQPIQGDPSHWMPLPPPPKEGNEDAQSLDETTTRRSEVGAADDSGVRSDGISATAGNLASVAPSRASKLRDCRILHLGEMSEATLAGIAEEYGLDSLQDFRRGLDWPIEPEKISGPRQAIEAETQEYPKQRATEIVKAAYTRSDDWLIATIANEIRKASEAEAQGWRPIKTAPKDGTEIFFRDNTARLTYAQGRVPRAGIARWSAFRECWVAVQMNNEEAFPTHWMPPPPPKEGSEDETRGRIQKEAAGGDGAGLCRDRGSDTLNGSE